MENYHKWYFKYVQIFQISSNMLLLKWNWNCLSKDNEGAKTEVLWSYGDSDKRKGRIWTDTLLAGFSFSCLRAKTNSSGNSPKDKQETFTYFFFLPLDMLNNLLG